MDPDRWRQIEDLYHELVALPESDRRRALEGLEADEALRREVRSLLEAESRTGGFLESSPLEEARIDIHDVLGERGEDPLVGTRIGHHLVIRHIATGGMGAVYEAEQDQPRRRVALKLMKWGVDTASARARFEAETEILGRLEHPAIARIYEAGFHDVGRLRIPWFAMEYVDGQPLTDDVRDRRLGTRRMLELFDAICEAVHYAHTRGVIHRDLKPANILVDPTGTPRILDFGVARATNADIQVTTVQTDVGQLVGTLPYMSPEQASGDPHQIDTRSDVYALGVVLYQLLAGRLPYDVTGKMLHEAVRIVREAEAAPLSSVNRVFRGDLDVIIARALEKDPARRYQSVLEFGSDIRRHLNNEPIVARPPGTFYQLRKFARRNRALVAGLGAIFAVLLIAVAVISFALARAVEAEASARRQADITTAINDFLLDDLLAAADPDRAFEPDVRLHEVLDTAAATLDERFKGSTAVKAELHRTIGRTYVRLGRDANAARHLEAALDLLSDAEHLDVREVLATRLDLASATWGRGDPGAAEAAVAALIEEASAALGAEDELVWAMRSQRALILEELGRFDEAESEHRAAMDGFREGLGPDDPATINAVNGFANFAMQLERYEEAERLLRGVLDTRTRILGPEHPRTSVSMGNLAELYRRMRRYDEAYELHQRIRTSDLQKYGADHPRTLSGTNNYALLCRDMGRLDEACELFEELVRHRRVVNGADHLATMISSFNLALVYVQLERMDEAVVLLDSIGESAARVLGEDNWYTGIFISKRAYLELERDDPAAAEPFARRAHPILEAQLGPGNSYTALNASYLWRICRADGRHGEAQQWFEAMPRGMQERLVALEAEEAAKAEGTPGP